MKSLVRQQAFFAVGPLLALGSAFAITRGLTFGQATGATALLAAGLILALLRPSERSLTVLLIVLLLALFAPSLLGGANTPVRAEDVVVAAAGGFLLISRVPIRYGALEVGLAGLAGVAALALLGSSLRTDLPTSWSDLLFFLRLAKYALVAIVVRQLVLRLGRHQERLLPLAAVFFALFALVGVAQYFGSTTAITAFPVQSSRAELLLDGASWRRAVGPIGNANYFGFVCAMGCAVACAQVAQRRSGWRGQLLAGSALCASLSGVVTSGSRTALFAAALMLCLVLLPTLLRVHAWRNIAGVVLAVSVGVAFLGDHLGSQPVIGRFRFLWTSSGATGDSLLSFEQRRAVWAQALSDVDGHWVFGVGPGKGVLSQWVDNDFIRIFRDFGAIGVTAFAVMLIWWAWRWWRVRAGDADGGRHVLALSLLVGTIMMSSASDVFYQPQVMGILLTLLAASTTTTTTRRRSSA